jgi:hypothetical protein
MADSVRDGTVAREQYDAYVYCRDNGHLKYQQKAQKCEEFFYGDQWDPNVLQMLKEQRRPALTFNKILPSMAAIFAEQLNARGDIGFKPAKQGTQETADALNRVFISISNMNSLPWIESCVFDDGAITSRGFFDVRMNYDENIFGEVDISLLNPMNVLVDPDAEEYDPDFWKEVITSKWYSLGQIEATWGPKVAREIGNKPESAFAIGYDFIDTRPDTFGGPHDNRFSYDTTQWDQKYRRRYRIIDRQYREVAMREHFVDMITGDTRPISPEMDREKIQRILNEFDVNIIKRKVEIIRWVLTADDLVLHNEESPYKHFTVVPFFPFFRRGRTVGLVENMIDPQELYNKTRSQELHIVNTTANSGWMIKQGSLKNMDIEQLEQRGAETGLVIELDDIGNAGKIQPNQVPTGLDRIGYMAAEDLKEISMASDSMRGFDRADVAAKAIKQKQAQGSANFAKVLDNLNFSRKLLATRVLDMVQDFYTEPRLIKYTTSGLLPKTEEIQINEITPEGTIARDMSLGKYEVVVSTVPSRETYEETQFEQAMQLRQLGIPIPDPVIIESSHLPNKHEIAEQVRQAQGSEGPSEQEQAVMQLEMQLKQLEGAKMQAEQKKIESETALNLVRAQVAIDDSEGANSDQVALEKAEQDFQGMLADLELRRYEIDQNIMVKREELAVKKGEVAVKAKAEADKARAQAITAKSSATAKPAPKKKPAKTS